MSAARTPSANPAARSRAAAPVSPIAHAVPLSQLLHATAQCLTALRSGRSGTAALEQVDPTLRPAVQALSFQVWRSLARAENLRRQLARRAAPPQADALLCVVLALAWDAPHAPYPPFTLVDQAVEAAKRLGDRGQAGFINACLRRFLRERDALVAVSERDPVAVWNHPTWWIERLRQDHPQHWQQVLTADGAHAPMTLRVNCRRSSQQAFMGILAEQGLAATAVGAVGVQLARPMPVNRIPGFDTGLVSVQDAAAQLAAPLLLDGLLPSNKLLRVLDACAAPGGKTAHLLEFADCAVMALDVDPVRCTRIGQTLHRLGLHADVRAADAALPAQWWDGALFDAILLDAPCTASGIVRRHPDVPWLRRASDVDQLCQQQARLLASLWPLLRNGGRMLYCTCSVFRAEGDIQVQTFVEHNTDAALLPCPGHLLPRLVENESAVPDNRQGDHDGFFYALLEKRTP